MRQLGAAAAARRRQRAAPACALPAREAGCPPFGSQQHALTHVALRSVWQGTVTMVPTRWGAADAPPPTSPSQQPLACLPPPSQPGQPHFLPAWLEPTLPLTPAWLEPALPLTPACLKP